MGQNNIDKELVIEDESDGHMSMSTDTRQKYQMMDSEQKKEQIKHLRIIHPRFHKALELIKRCHESTAISTDPQCMLITYPSGSGKSTILKLIYVNMIG